MSDFSNKALYFGLGLLNVTREKAESLVDDLVRRGEVEQEEGKRWVEDLVEKGQKQREEVRNFMEQEMERMLHRLRVPSRGEVQALEERLQKAEARLAELEGEAERE